MTTSSKQKGTADRTNNWTCIVYPDSLPLDWKEQIEETTIQVCVSPLHDMDVWTEKDEKQDPKKVTGTKKKPHYHVVIMYGDGNKKSLAQVQEDFAFLNGTNFKKVMSKVGMIQYLDHRFCKFKHHYDERDVLSFNGFDYEEAVSTPVGRMINISLIEMRKYIIENEIIEISELQLLCDEKGDLSPWYMALDSKFYQMSKFIDSYRNKRKEEKEKEQKKLEKKLAEERQKGIQELREMNLESFTKE